ncbi:MULTISPECIES: polyamine aminopropyltransferase [unclassified Spirosoma]|uniref:polyamine aminopropyltransferase n=1 Tax=unclassified Spirosoma TaxID=2621999 RepID=UPI0009593FCA|nr:MULTISPECIES: polyamine aminopropyltransferase [unclassified Spirosoma]MBN8826214.1 polyamine aminopropyltransferase [Spirosoma sp.]OJW76891.1 MAG: spermidine synthase [Spirosoma sp. 48-14]
MVSPPKQVKPPSELRPLHWLLLVSVFVIATCGLIYELVAGTLASYLLGDSVTQFSTIIGVYLFSMGIGSWLSKYLDGNLLKWFIQIELLVGLVGGFSVPLLFVLFEQVASFRLLLYLLVGFTGALVGLEIPLLMRILENQITFKDLVSRVFTFDYIGSLLASLVFPLWLVPQLGLIRTSLFFGLLNVGVAGFLLYRFAETRSFRAVFTAILGLSISGLMAAFVYAEKIMAYSEGATFQDAIIYSKSTPYQRIVLTRNNRELRLYLNGNLQFSSADEYRYHEALVHPAMQARPTARRVLVLGGGDGLAVRELLKYPAIQQIRLVDLDPAMTSLFRHNPVLVRLNQRSLLSPRVEIINKDAFTWIREDTARYDVMIVDFPDPSNYSIGKLYSTTFYTELEKRLAPDGIIVVQSTSPYVARKSFWCVRNTLVAVGFQTIPYHAYVPSFGEWGYVLALRNQHWRVGSALPTGLRFVNAQTIRDMLYFPPDMAAMSTEVNKLNNQVLVQSFEEEWAPYGQ